MIKTAALRFGARSWSKGRVDAGGTSHRRESFQSHSDNHIERNWIQNTEFLFTSPTQLQSSRAICFFSKLCFTDSRLYVRHRPFRSYSLRIVTSLWSGIMTRANHSSADQPRPSIIALSNWRSVCDLYSRNIRYNFIRMYECIVRGKVSPAFAWPFE